jgi:hypothetical protein
VAGLEVREVGLERPGRGLIVLRQRVAERAEAGGKRLLELPGYRFQALVTNLPASVDAPGVWRRYNGRAEIETGTGRGVMGGNRIRELGEQFGIKRLCCQSFVATEALHHLAIAAYNLCVLLQRRLGQLAKCELTTPRWRLFARAAVWGRVRGKPTLRLAVRGAEARHWWQQMLLKLSAPFNCNAVERLQT